MNDSEISKVPPVDPVEMRRPLGEHLDELLVRLRRVFFWVILGCVAGYLLAGTFMTVIELPLHELSGLSAGRVAPELITISPFEKFWVYFRVAFIAGVFFVIPFIAWEVAGFVGPGLKAVEKRRIFWLMLSVYVFFVVGIVLGYYFVLPVVWKAIVNFGGHEAMRWTLSAYINTTLGILLASALLLELPVVMTHLSSWGWVEAAAWAQGRKTALVINSVVSGILSPPDVMSMLIMMVPIQILYEIGILLARVAQWVRNEKKSA